MNGPHSLRCYDYVNQPYNRVRDALRKDAAAIFRRATTNAVERTNAVGAQLHVHVGVLDVAADIALEVGEPKEVQLEQIEPATEFPVSPRPPCTTSWWRSRIGFAASSQTQPRNKRAREPSTPAAGSALPPFRQRKMHNARSVFQRFTWPTRCLMRAAGGATDPSRR